MISIFLFKTFFLFLKIYHSHPPLFPETAYLAEKLRQCLCQLEWQLVSSTLQRPSMHVLNPSGNDSRDRPSVQVCKLSSPFPVPPAPLSSVMRGSLYFSSLSFIICKTPVWGWLWWPLLLKIRGKQILCKKLDSKYFSHCRPSGFWYNSSTVHDHERAATDDTETNEYSWVPINFIIDAAIWISRTFHVSWNYLFICLTV